MPNIIKPFITSIKNVKKKKYKIAVLVNVL